MLCACVSAPQDRFYTLSAAQPAMPGSPVQPARYSVAVGPVRIPEIVDRPQLVIRESDNRVGVLERHRWAQSLRAEIARVVAADLSRQLNDARVVPGSDYAGQIPDYRILVDIDRFEATPGEGVTVQAAWTVRRTKGDAATSGRSVVREASRGAGYEELAAAYGRALVKMSVEMADAVRSLQAGAS
jgi:hypothetical protein